MAHSENPFLYKSPIRLYKPNDPYYFEVDNLPLEELLSNTNYLKNEIEFIISQLEGYVTILSMMGGSDPWLYLGNMLDVAADSRVAGSISDGSLLVYNTTNTQWEAELPPDPTITLDDLSDVSLDAYEGHILSYNNTPEGMKWTNTGERDGMVGNVPLVGDILTYSENPARGNRWIAAPPTVGFGETVWIEPWYIYGTGPADSTVQGITGIMNYAHTDIKTAQTDGGWIGINWPYELHYDANNNQIIPEDAKAIIIDAEMRGGCRDYGEVGNQDAFFSIRADAHESTNAPPWRVHLITTKAQNIAGLQICDTNPRVIVPSTPNRTGGSRVSISYKACGSDPTLGSGTGGFGWHVWESLTIACVVVGYIK